MRTVLNFLYLLHLRFSHNFSVLIRSHELSAFWLLRENFTGHLCKLRKEEDKRLCKWLLKFPRTHNHPRHATLIETKGPKNFHTIRLGLSVQRKQKMRIKCSCRYTQLPVTGCFGITDEHLGSTAQGNSIGKVSLDSHLNTQSGFQTMTTSYHLADSTH